MPNNIKKTIENGFNQLKFGSGQNLKFTGLNEF